MNKPWYSLSNVSVSDDKKVTANVIVPAESSWFSGHFPGEPILPGIAQLSMIFDLINQCYYNNTKQLKISSLKKVRFKFLVKPEDLLEIKLHSADKPENTFSFKITKGDETACSGFITVENTI